MAYSGVHPPGDRAPRRLAGRFFGAATVPPQNLEGLLPDHFLDDRARAPVRSRRFTDGLALKQRSLALREIPSGLTARKANAGERDGHAGQKWTEKTMLLQVSVAT